MHRERLDLNEMIGAATILAVINGMAGAVSYPLSHPSETFAFFLFFLLVRFKMYLDDKKHVFDPKDILDQTLAVASWVLFVFAALALSNNLTTALLWTALALIASTAWVAVSFLKRASKPDARLGELIKLYGFWAFINLAQAAFLVLLAADRSQGFADLDGAKGLIYCVLIGSVLVDWILTPRLRGRKAPETEEKARLWAGRCCRERFTPPPPAETVGRS